MTSTWILILRKHKGSEVFIHEETPMMQDQRDRMHASTNINLNNRDQLTASTYKRKSEARGSTEK